MSRSTANDILDNPAVKKFRWSGKHGEFTYYDKEDKNNIEVPFPFRFLLLDTTSTITGFNEDKEEGYYSNEIKDTKKEALRVRSKSGLLAEGLYADIKDKLKAAGAKYAQNLYIAFKDTDGEMKIGVLMVSGSSMSGGTIKDENKNKIPVPGWMDFKNDNNRRIYKSAVVVNDTTECVKGDNTYFVPNFEIDEVTEDENAAAEELDNILQAYLKSYFANSYESSNTEEETKKPSESVPRKEPVKSTPKTEKRDEPYFDPEDDDLPF